ncbi:MAG: hypothetical protein EHM39_09660, partial [Chloroflexi bacterium]
MESPFNGLSFLNSRSVLTPGVRRIETVSEAYRDTISAPLWFSFLQTHDLRFSCRRTHNIHTGPNGTPTKVILLNRFSFKESGMKVQNLLVRLALPAALIALLMVGLGTLVSAQENTPPPQSVTIAGTVQSVLGCSGDWQPECEETFLTYSAADDLWMATWDLPAGSYEYKAALNGAWDEDYGLGAEPGGANIP